MGCGQSTATEINQNEVDLSHFELLKVVGKGGFGKVNAVQLLKTGELLALKRMEKYSVLQSNSHLRMVWIERKIMSAMRDSEFLVHLNYAFQSPTELFLVMPFMQGGDLRYHLKERGCMSEVIAQFYAAEMILGLEALHKKHIAFRDLKPENMLLDADGHLRISDYGLACILKRENNYSTTGQAGTRGYQAPEVITDQYYGVSADVWSFGITLYELLHGFRPFKDWSRVALLRDDDINKTPTGSYTDEYESEYTTLHVSSRLSPATHSLLRGLLRVDLTKRLGCQSDGWQSVKSHAFFKDIDWYALAEKRIVPPIKPDPTRANCTADADLADQLLDRKPRDILPEQQDVFQNWNFRTELPENSTEIIVTKSIKTGHGVMDVAESEARPVGSYEISTISDKVFDTTPLTTQAHRSHKSSVSQGHIKLVTNGSYLNSNK